MSLTRPEECPREDGRPCRKAFSHAIPVDISPDPGLHPVAHGDTRLGRLLMASTYSSMLLHMGRGKPEAHVK